jgi:hypothetical protein
LVADRVVVPTRLVAHGSEMSLQASVVWVWTFDRDGLTTGVEGTGRCQNRVDSRYHTQVHLDAPLEEVWELVGNPATYPDWWPAAVEIQGEKFEVGDSFTQVVGAAGRRLEYSRIIERREELRELRWHCPTTGGFQHWLLRKKLA